MARLRRPVERQGRRQRIIDRLIAAGLAVIAVAGAMSFASGPRQAAVSQVGCLVGSLGLANCRDEVFIAEPVRLGEPRCRFLAELDAALPEVNSGTVNLPSGLVLTTSRARSGEIVVQAGPPTATHLPELLAGEERRSRYPAPGLEVPAHSEWLLPPGQGIAGLAAALENRHDQEARANSAMALFARLIHPVGGSDVPAPNVRYSSLSLATGPFPVINDAARPEPRDGDLLALDRNQPATAVYRSDLRQVAVIAPITGSVQGRPAAGVVRWTRDESARLTSILIMVVSTDSLITGAPVIKNSISVGYASIPIQTDAERALAERWLSERSGFAVPTGELFGLAAASPKDRLTSWLTRAAAVTVLRYQGVGTEAALDRASEEVRRFRRTEWTDAPLVTVHHVPPRPDGTARKPVDDPSCGRP